MVLDFRSLALETCFGLFSQIGVHTRPDETFCDQPLSCLNARMCEGMACGTATNQREEEPEDWSAQSSVSSACASAKYSISRTVGCATRNWLTGARESASACRMLPVNWELNVVDMMNLTWCVFVGIRGECECEQFVISAYIELAAFDEVTEVLNSITNFSSKFLSRAALTALSKGLRFIPTPTHLSKLKLKTDIRELSRSMRIKHHFRNSRKAFSPHPLKKKSKWDPGSTTNPNLLRYLYRTPSRYFT